MALSSSEVKHVAKLARLELTEDEVEALAADLTAILEYFESLKALDSSDVPQTANLAAERPPLRADVVRPGLSNTSALAEAPRHAGGAFAVPKFVDDG